jgi:hypothetical protein
MLRAAAIVLLIALLPSPLRAEARIALLIGRSAAAARSAASYQKQGVPPMYPQTAARLNGYKSNAS